MAEITNVKMRLILPNNDQESFVNAINYNFHQLANIANHVDAKRGEKGEQGLPGAQGKEGPKGDRGPGIFTFVGGIDDLTNQEKYKKFINDNGISEGDMIMYNGVIYNYSTIPEDMYDYITDNKGEEGKNRYVNTDFSEDISEKIKTQVEQTVGGSMTFAQVDGNTVFVTPKTPKDINLENFNEDRENFSMPALFTTGIDAEQVKTLVGGNLHYYSINSLCHAGDTINMRLGFGSFTEQNRHFSTINFYEPSTGDDCNLIFNFTNDENEYTKSKANYIFNVGNEFIASISNDDSHSSIKLSDIFSIRSSFGSQATINSDKVLNVRSNEEMSIFSNKSVSIGVPDESDTFIKLYDKDISIYANSTQGESPQSSIVLCGKDPKNARIDIKSRIVFLYGLSVQLQSAHNIIKADGANDCDIKMSREFKLGNGEISNSYITLNKDGLLLSYFHPTDTNKSSIALKTGYEGLSTIEISSVRYILSHNTFNNLKGKNGINLDNVNVDAESRYYRTYLASDSTLALASNNNILLFPGKLKDDGNGYINLYTEKLLIHNNMYYVEKETPGWYGVARDTEFKNAHGSYLASPQFFNGDGWSRLCVKPIVFGQYITFNIYTHAYGGNITLSMYMTEDDDSSIEMLYDYIKSVGCSSSDDTYHIGLSLSLIPLESKEATVNTNEIVTMCQIGAYFSSIRDKKCIYIRIHTENLKSDSNTSGYYDWMGTITVPYK